MNNVMVDLETMGSSPGCAIVSIGAVEFDPASGALGKEFYAVTSLKSSLAIGLTVSADTIMWWLNQSREARAAIALNPTHICDAMVSFGLYLNPEAKLWSHGASFDLPVLKAAYDICNFSVPWKFRNERDTRTVFDVTDSKMISQEGGTAHHALADAKNQALSIIQALKRPNIYHAS